MQIKKLMRKETLLVALTWFLVVASITMCANATAGARLLASEQVDYPQDEINLLYAANNLRNIGASFC
ncbi:hypothetical protein NC653_015389 [Populus alba x Populus x berolinensis]|uniref:Uncharacterized protein n=1 Tax=Populus alba x Populus x berolinensis TaxID=444605 RepID=A0AAD6QKL6_9ROSI|nr:hypothetical protein NC653_015386 [Populus alba x Populus x berolinensis]KAJ6992019.1 hypothetical protein NC653_015389 [Populus alba x Populus x berolinensis]